MNKDLFAHEALAQIPKILTLLDRNPHSPTYGCFDRSFLAIQSHRFSEWDVARVCLSSRSIL